MTPPNARRLLIVSQPLEAGVPRHVLDLVRLLDPDEYRVTVACPRESDLWRNLQSLPTVTLCEIASQREPAAVDALTLARLLPLVRNADIVHAHSSKAGFMARLAAAVQGRAESCIFTPHGWSFWSADGARAHFYTRLERMSARWCRTILAVSDYERLAGLGRGVGAPQQYRVIRNGVDLPRFHAPPAPIRDCVIMVGRLAAPKRPDLALQAIASLRKRFPRVQLLLVGDGVNRVKVESLVAQLGLHDCVHLLGIRDDVPALLSRAACLVFASDYEACPLSILEAMAASVPIVATRVGGVPEIIEHDVSGLLVRPESPDALAAAVAHMLENPERARAMGEAGRRRAHADFSSAKMAGTIVEVYRQTMPARHAGRVRHPSAASLG